MKILYIGPFRDGTGYAVAARNTILAMDKVGIEVYPRHLKLAAQIVEPESRIQELMKQKHGGNFDVVIQHALPPLFTYIQGVKNIGYFYAETTHFRPSGWQYHLNLMDEIWVSCPENKLACEKSGVTVPVKVVPIPANTEIYQKDYGKFSFIGNRFAFYVIGDFSNRKNILNLARAYFEEFTRYDNVVLIIKAYVEGKSQIESQQIMQNSINGLKHSLRKHTVDIYPPVVIINEYMSDEKIYRIHQSCDCFVSLERGAAWNIPAMDAMGFGNMVIANEWGGQNQFLSSNYNDVVLVKSKPETVGGMNHCPYPNLYTCHEEWYTPDLSLTKGWMRTFYNKAEGNKVRKIRRMDWYKEWGLESSGLKIKKVLES